METKQRKKSPPNRRKPTARPKTAQKPRAEKSPDVVYTPPKPFNRNRFLLRLVTVAAVVLAVMLGISIFFKVEVISVSGHEKYSAWTVREASGIVAGENLLTFGNAKAGSKILNALPYVKTARIGIKLPDTVNIVIEEYAVSYAIKAGDGTWWLISSDGKVLEKIDGALARDYTNILGVQIADPVVGQKASAFAQQTVDQTTVDETTATSATKPLAVTASQQLNIALDIVTYLENNEILGKIASVDVTDLVNIQLWYGQQYQVELGDASRLEYKISYMKAAIEQMADYQSGVLDVSFKIWTDEAGYTPF